MYRECGLNGIRWPEKTMSMMKAAEADSCEAFLRDLPAHGIFDSECTFTDAEKLYAASFFGMEDPVPDRIISPEELRDIVLRNYPVELMLLSSAEHELLLKLIFFGGKMILSNDNDLIAASYLAARLWITTVLSASGDIEINIPKQLLATAVLVLSSDKYKQCRDLITGIDDSIERTLYLYGYMQVGGPLNHIRHAITELAVSPDERFLYRFFRASYHYTFSPDGIMLLVHPGLAHINYRDPGFIFRGDAMVETDEDSLRSIINELEPQEQPLYDQMSDVLNNCIRPEISAEDAVEDLIMLAKQDVSESEMKQVLSDLVSGVPTVEMKIALHNIHERIPRWVSLSSSRLQ